MPLEPATPAYKAAVDGFIAEVQKLMREKLVGIGDYHNLGDIEAEIDRCSLRIELLGTDPEFQESVKKLDAKRIDLARKRDQIKPFLLKLERELAIYRGALGAEPELALGQAVEEEPTIPMQAIEPPPAQAPAPRSAAPAFQASPAPAPMPHAFQPAAPPPTRPPVQAAPRTPAPAPAPAPMRPPMAPAPAPVVQVEEDLLLAGPELDMSLPPEEPMDDVNFLAAPSDFLADAASTNQGDFAGGPELTLDTIPSALSPATAPPPAAAAPPSAGAQWPPPGQAIPDPFSAFQGGRPPAGAPPQAPPRPAPASAVPPARPAAPAPAPAAPRPAAPPAAGAAAAKPGVKPPWVK